MEKKICMEDKIEFIPKMCPTCKEPLAVKWLGVWGYYCTDCMFWWGTYDPWPKLRKPTAKKPRK